MATDENDAPQPADAPAGPLVEVYRARNWMEVDRARVEVLEPSGVTAFVHDRTSHALPAPATEPGIYALAVAASEADKARDLLAEAQDDGVLDGEEGQIVD